jgi:hypothetical protein
MERGNISQSVGERASMFYSQKRRSNDAQKLSWYFFAHKVFSVIMLQRLQFIVETSTGNY